jgi:hypothetical protein
MNINGICPDTGTALDTDSRTEILIASVVDTHHTVADPVPDPTFCTDPGQVAI